jgi:hypothetical protein
MRPHLIAFSLLVLAVPAAAQENPDHAHMDHSRTNHDQMDHSQMNHDQMPGMDHDAMDHDGMDMSGDAMPAMLWRWSGTSWQPNAAPTPGIHTMLDGWMTMLLARVWGVADSQSGPRGDSKILAPGMLMAMAQKDFGANDTLGLRTMFSLDPFMGRRGYPLLLANGETADGKTHLVDRQHPHDLFMELGATWTHRLSDTDSLFLYGGYPGEPALGPTAYMMRISAMDSPATPIAHHWLDSTHITFGVVTAGWVHDGWKLEVSRFTGREPDQRRFDFERARFDSTAARLSWNPDGNWSLQVSGGFLNSPEQLDPDHNETRFTASATYYNAFPIGSVAATLAYGRKHLSDGVNEDAALFETEFKPTPLWTIFARAETISSNELVPGHAVRQAGEVSLGLVRDFRVADGFKLGVGGLYSVYFTPASAVAPYGGGPRGAMAFVRLLTD